MLIYDQIKKTSRTIDPALAQDYFDCSCVNLKKYPANPELLIKQHLDLYIKLSFVPWRIINNKIHFIASTHSNELLEYLQDIHGKNFVLLYCPKQQILKHLQLKYSQDILEETISKLFTYNKNYSAFNLINKKHRITLYLCLIISTLLLCVYPNKFFIGFITCANVIFLLNSITKITLLCIGSFSKKEVTYQDINAADLPVYTILLPIYKEDTAILSLVKSIMKLDYPTDKLDVKLIIEQFDRQTIQFIKKLQLHNCFEIICVPKSMPKTKPKACSYALKFARGDFVTVYDAEDKPEPLQLKKAVQYFKHNKDVACIQARLNFYNSGENLLSHFFSIEYAMNFDYFLKGLQTLGIPLPLGGSSNHFRREILENIQAWDPYNVTEDADIGFRLALHGFKSKMFDSITLEEAPINLLEWINQRTRWIKGHIQTFIVHSRNYELATKQIGLWKALGFHFFLICPIIAYFLQFIVLFTGHSFLLLDLFKTQFDMIWNFSCINIYIWYSFTYLSIIITSYKKVDLEWKSFLYPYYFLLHPFAVFQACSQLINAPYYWHKTTHSYYKRHKIKFTMPFLKKITKKNKTKSRQG